MPALDASGGERPVASVIIPAHDESAVIEGSLRTLLGDVPAGTLEVVVVCNGCSDDTADRARTVARAHPSVAVVDTPVASKTHALELGDAEARTFPRAYLDADVRLPGRSVVAVAQALAAGPAVAGRPPFRYDTTGATWPVRRYYAARERIPSIATALWGAGVYVLTEQARGRFGEWPPLVGDDLFIDTLFSRDERAIVDTEPALVRTPRTTAALLATLRRVQRGKRQQADAPRTTGRWVGSLARSATTGPSQALDAAVYAALATTARIPVRRRTGAPEWERDESSRVST